MKNLAELRDLALDLARTEVKAKELRFERDNAILELYGLPKGESATQAKLAEATGLSQKQISAIIKRGMKDSPSEYVDPDKQIEHMLELRAVGVSILEISRLTSKSMEYVVHVLNNYGGERIYYPTS